MCVCCLYINAGQTLDIRLPSEKHERYIPVTKWNYCLVLGAFKNWNIIEFSSKSTSSETFDEIHHVVIDGISDNIASLVESGKY